MRRLIIVVVVLVLFQLVGVPMLKETLVVSPMEVACGTEC